eukprot:6279630-Lingulodinium_polyedra.AAC.1
MSVSPMLGMAAQTEGTRAPGRATRTRNGHTRSHTHSTVALAMPLRCQQKWNFRHDLVIIQ